MALVTASATPSGGAHERAALRDPGMDLVRALCVVGVVVLHALMVGVTVHDDSPLFSNATTGAWWIVPVSWVLQVMPLFFVIAGFSGLLSYRRHRVRGGSDAAFVAARVQRLLRPALFAVAVVGAALAIMLQIGVPAAFVEVAGYRYGQPLWFLAVFLGCQALLPILVRLHERTPLRTIGALATCAVTVDVLRTATGVEALGYLNLAFVWIALQQLGFFLADGTFDAMSRRIRVLLGASAVTVLVVSWVLGIFSPDLIANINPPTSALLLVGVAHTSLLSLFRDRVTAFSRRPLPTRITSFVTPRTMTIYLWHMPVLLAMAGISAVIALQTGIALPALGGAEWWGWRPLWLLVTLVVTALVARALEGAERKAATTQAPSAAAATAAVLLGVGGTVGLLVLGTSPLTAAAAFASYVLALRWTQGSGGMTASYARPRALSASPTSSA